MNDFRVKFWSTIDKHLPRQCEICAKIRPSTSRSFANMEKLLLHLRLMHPNKFAEMYPKGDEREGISEYVVIPNPVMMDQAPLVRPLRVDELYYDSPKSEEIPQNYSAGIDLDHISFFSTSTNSEANISSVQQVEQFAVKEETIVDEYCELGYAYGVLPKVNIDVPTKDNIPCSSSSSLKVDMDMDDFLNDVDFGIQTDSIPKTEPDPWESEKSEFNFVADFKPIMGEFDHKIVSQENPSTVLDSLALFCRYCLKQFPDVTLLKAHQNRKHKESTSRSCNYCLEMFTNVTHLKIHHDQQHNIEGENHCPHCDKNFHRMTTFNIHLRTHQPSKKHPAFHCPICDIIFYHQSEFKTHCKGHWHQIETSRMAVGQENTKIVLEATKSFKDLMGLWWCCYCFEKFENSYQLKRHHDRKHSLQGKIHCPHCDKKFHGWVEFKIHLRTHKPPKKRRGRRRKYWSKKSNKKKHNQIKTVPLNPNGLHCSICDIIFDHQSEFATHCSTHWPDQIQPDQQEIEKSEFVLAEDCGPSTDHKIALDQEKGAKAFKDLKVLCCCYCFETFKNVSYLKRHQDQTHNIEGNFRCPHCVKNFHRKTALEIHYGIHHYQKVRDTIDPPFSNKTSDEHTGQQSVINSIDEERVSVIVEGDFPCSLCGQMFYNQAEFKTHCRIHWPP